VYNPFGFGAGAGVGADVVVGIGVGIFVGVEVGAVLVGVDFDVVGVEVVSPKVSGLPEDIEEAGGLFSATAGIETGVTTAIES
jgi:hypothetical protein